MRDWCTTSVQRAGDLLADRAVRQPDVGHQRQRLDPAQRLLGRACVDGAQRPVVTGAHRAEHVQRLGAPDLADDDPVGPHPQRVAHERADRDLAAALDRCRAAPPGG